MSVPPSFQKSKGFSNNPSSRALRLNAAAYKDTFVMSRSAKALAGVVRFLSDMHVGGKDEIESCRAMALALPRVCVVAVSLLRPHAARLHATAAALISQVAALFVFVLPLPRRTNGSMLA
jgi:hypothetical protein